MTQTPTPPEERSPEAAQSREEAQRRADASFWENYQRHEAERCEAGRLRHEDAMRALTEREEARARATESTPNPVPPEAIAAALDNAIEATRAAPVSARARRLALSTLLHDVAKLAEAMALVYGLPDGELPQMAGTLRRQASEAFDLIAQGDEQ
jgi:hypothetical protein